MSTTLNGNIISSDTTITVIDASGFTSSGIIIIELEEISYSGISGNQFTGCTRGIDGTIAILHNSGVQVSQVIATTNYNGKSPTIAHPFDSTIPKSYHASNLTIPARQRGQVRIISSGIVVPSKRQASTSGRSGGAFGSNALDYTMRGFHVGLGHNVSWKAPFNDVNATQYFGSGGTPGTITNVVILARK